MKDKYVISSPVTESEFEAYFALRWEVLRKPWGQPQGSEKDEQENQATQLMAVDEKGGICGVCRLDSIDQSTAQIRYMAVKPGLHGQGIGRDLLLQAERNAKEKGFQRIFLQSRENACGFYERQGYHTIEKTFLLFNKIQHFSMEKSLF